jgi:dienelactone hydrolase
MDSVEYFPGRCADVFGDPKQPTVLMWHGAQTDARASMRPLAERVHARGLSVVVPDWDSHADDGGRSDLLRSAHYARARAGGSDGLIVVGWSMGGVAAAGLAIHASEHGMRLIRAVCLAGAFMVRDPISGERIAQDIPGGQRRTPFVLLHGTADAVVPIDASRTFAAALRHNGWPVEFEKLSTDHAAIAGASYDTDADRYEPAADPASLAIADDVAARIAG